MFETTGILEEKFIEKNSLPKEQRLLHNVGFYMFGVASCLCLLARDYLFFILSIVAVILVGLYRYQILYKNINIYRHFFNEGETEVEITTRFLNDGVHVSGSDKEAIIKYELLDSIEKKKDVYVIYTRGLKTIFVFLDELEDEEKFIGFLKKKTHIRLKTL